MTPAYQKAITTAKEELNAKRTRNRDPVVSAVVRLGSLKAKTSDEQHCMLDSGASVLVIPWKAGMKGEKTMCTFVGENKTEG